jgi:crossover junction endodeoxyribonuclease RusA
MITIELPYPPSVNHYWRRVGHTVLISRAGRRFRDDVIRLCRASGLALLPGALTVEVDVYPPDNRRRDLDNIQKALFDAMAHGGLYDDDSQLTRIVLTRMPALPRGKVVVRISPFTGKDTQ